MECKIIYTGFINANYNHSYELPLLWKIAIYTQPVAGLAKAHIPPASHACMAQYDNVDSLTTGFNPAQSHADWPRF
jgi:hypothetical protein